ncbi:MAG TPA: hypothetical protein VGU01_14845 [Sphingomicrobium sp.]|nr:hypothetical protein [Sphingomicrobium sp.]
MSAPEAIPAGGKPAPRRNMSFRKRSKVGLPTPEQARRQSGVIQSAWSHFREPGPVIAFLNTRHEVLGGQPLHLAIESEEGLRRVETLLEQLTLKS